MQDWSCKSSHATPSEIERREFCNGIKDTVTKTDVYDHSCICSSLRELNPHGLCDGAATGTLWLYILSSCGLSEYRKFFHFLFLCPMTVLALLLLCTILPQYSRTQSLFPAFFSVISLFRDIACIQSKTLLVPDDREPWDRV